MNHNCIALGLYGRIYSRNYIFRYIKYPMHSGYLKLYVNQFYEQKRLSEDSHFCFITTREFFLLDKQMLFNLPYSKMY